MPPPKRVLCLMDLSTVGRAGLSAVVPVLAACGVQACALPTALFSSHTGGFQNPARQDMAPFCQEALARYASENVSFDAIYTGYLFGPAQFTLARAALQQYPNALHIQDPAMADDGKMYHGMGPETAEDMRALCQDADVITPNFTESALLLGLAPDDALHAPDGADLASARLEALCSSRRSVVITSVPGEGGTFETIGCAESGKKKFAVPSERVPQHYPGTGDAFTAAMCGLLLQGESLATAAKKAAAFVEAAAKTTFEGGAQARHGLWLEAHLHMLHPRTM